MKKSAYKIATKVRKEIFSYLGGEWTSAYEKAFLFDNQGKLAGKWVGTEGGIEAAGVMEKVAEIKRKSNYPIFVHTHPTMTSFSGVDFEEIILDDALALGSQWIVTKNINFIFVPRDKKFLQNKEKIIAYINEKQEYIWHNKEASRLLKEKAFKGENFPNAYKYFWNSYVTAMTAAFMGADFSAVPLNKKGEKYCKLMKKGLKVLSGLELKIS